MKEHEGDGLDRSTSKAWRRFQAALADHLAAMGEDEVLVVDVLTGRAGEGGADPYLQFCAWGDGMLRAEVSSNHVLTPLRQLSTDAERAVEALGFAAPTYGLDDEPDAGSLNFYVDLEAADADRLAVMSVRVLRDVFGVPAPAFLRADGLADEPPVPVEPDVPVDEPPAVFPEGGAAQLRDLVDAALTPYLGHSPAHDDDDDVPLEVGHTVLYVRVHETAPIVELFACVATSVQELRRAAFEVAVLNRDVRFVRFRVVDDNIVAFLHLPSWPFAPEHLRAMVAVMSETIERLETDLATRVSGRYLLDDSEQPDDADDPGDADEWTVEAPEDDDAVSRDRGGPADLSRTHSRAGSADRAGAILLHLEADSAGSVTPELAATICGHDPDVILELIGRHRGGSRRATAMVPLLRRALRLVVERQAGDPPSRLAEASARPRRKRPRPRRVPDPTIEEVDPEIWG